MPTEFVATQLLLRGFELTDEHTREAGRPVTNGLEDWIVSLADDLAAQRSLGYWRKELQYDAKPCEECMLIARMRKLVVRCTCTFRKVVSSGLIFAPGVGHVRDVDPLCDMHGAYKLVDGDVVRRR
jgi:hypothetical protein